MMNGSSQNIDKRKLRQQSVDGTDSKDGAPLKIPSSSASPKPTTPRSKNILQKAFSLQSDSHEVSETYFEKQAEFSAITYLPLNNQIYRFFLK